jgi:cellulose synthase operon protein C
LARDNFVPDHVTRSLFYSAVLLMDGGRFGEAKERLKGFAKMATTYPLRPEALLRLGICEVQLKEGPAALATLQPLVNKDRSLADQVLLWTARAAVLVVPDAGPQSTRDKAVARAVDMFTRAASAAQELEAADASAKQRRGEILLELVDILLRFNRAGDAVRWCQELQNKQLLAERKEELAQRTVEALHLAGEYDKADAHCRLFLQNYPDSQFKPAVLFRFAENSYFRSLAAEKDPGRRDDVPTLKKLREEALKSYQALVEDYPDYPRASNARFAMGMLFLKLGDGKNAANVFEQIPPTERTGERAIASLLFADLILKDVPAGVPEDALSAGKMEVELKKAADMLESYAAAETNGPQTADALIRLGQTLQRVASLQAHVLDRNKLYQDARNAFERVLQPQFNNNPLQALAFMERARCRVLYGGDQNKSITELRQFANDPLKTKPAAPLAIIQAAVWLRDQNKNADAVSLISKFAYEYAKRPQSDPMMRGLLAYHHGLALHAAGNLQEAVLAFEEAIRLIPGKTEGSDAAIRLAVCRKDETAPTRETITRLWQNPVAASQANARKLSEKIEKILAETAAFLDAEADKLKDRQPPPEVRARMLYESAWIYRTMADLEIAGAKAKKIAALEKELGEKLKKMAPLEVSLAEVLAQPSEAKARARYAALIEIFQDTPLSLEARVELAECLAERNETAEAIKILVDAIDREPSPELTEKARFLLGTCHAARGNHKQALAQFDIIGQADKSPLAAQARYRAGEVYMDMKNYAEAAKRFAVFRDVARYRQLTGLSDRALLRLGHALAAEKQWDTARQAHDTLLKSYAGSKWTQDAHYGIGFAHEQMNQYEQAAQAYLEATTGALSETAAMAQLRIGISRMALKRFEEAAEAFLAVPKRFAYDQWNAMALLETAEAYAQLNRKEQQVEMLNRVVREYEKTPWAQEAKQRLTRLQKG